MTKESREFGAEVDKVLNLMIHSLYTNKDICIRELISNASDACDKLRYLLQTDQSLKNKSNDFKITVKINKQDRSLSIIDNGIGMNKEDLIEHLGTIAKSGTQGFLKQLSGDEKKDNLLIGQFGVGFYSAFMIADKITVISKKANEDLAYKWESNGVGGYTVSDEPEFDIQGTQITLDIKGGEDQYLDNFRLRNILNTYSDHIAIPIYLVDEDGNEEQVNSSSAIWTRSKSDITEEAYKEFYKSVSHSPDDPWLRMHNRREGVIEFISLLYIPSTKTFDLFHPDRKHRVKLYIKRVLIGDENINIIPSYLRFIRGVVDSEDLPLNISRETLQHSSKIDKINQIITNQVLTELKKKKDESIDEYNDKFWKNFGAVLKEGLCEATSDHNKILEVSIFKSALSGKMISLDDYISNMKEDQSTIYYLSGDSAEKLLASPQIEGFLNKKIDVLLFTDNVDDFWVNINSKYQDYEIKSVTRSDIDLDSNDSSKKNSDTKDVTNDQYTKLIDYFKEVLGETVKDVKISKKLTSSPACLVVSNQGMDMRMERFLMEQKQLSNASIKILEINPNNNIIEKINKDLIDNATIDNSDLVKIIFDEACIVEGESIHDVASFVKRMNDILSKVIERQ
ncbi:MAG: molecular chaperone HtpG [Rickettsiaceae bacterium]